MQLRTLGGLALAGTRFGQRQAMLVLAYVGLEGPKERAHLAELFWPEAKRPLNNLSSAATRLRAIDPDLIVADRYTFGSTVEIDVQQLVEFASAGHHMEAVDLYRGRFLDGFPLEQLHPELQEWILDRRSAVADLARRCALDRATAASGEGRTSVAVEMAERGLAIGADAVPDPSVLRLAHPILVEGRSVLLAGVEAEALDLGITFDTADPQPIPAVEPMAKGESMFIGRDVELSELRDIVGPGRPVVVVGPGGAGKSRLAKETGRVFGAGLGPLCWIDADPLNSPAELASVIAGGLLRPDELMAVESSDDLGSIASIVGDRSGLLVVDSVEHLADDLSMMEPLLACRNLSILLTSRREIAWPAAARLKLEGLSVAAGGAPGPAVSLLRGCMQRRRPSDAPPADDETLIELCRRLGGLPLAIEMVGGWAGVLSPEEMLTELESDISLLQDVDQDFAPHHRSFEAVFARSWELLDQGEREVIDRLSVFPAGFDRSAAISVGSCSLLSLRRLVDASLLVRRSDYFRCHSLVRRFGRLRLADQPGLEREAQRSHADLMLRASLEATDGEIAEHDGSLSVVEDPAADLMQAWKLAVELQESDLIVGLVDPIDRLFSRQGRHGAALDAFEAAATAMEDWDTVSEAAVAHLELHRAWLYMVVGRYRRALELAETMLGRELDGLDEVIVDMARLRAMVLRREGRVDEARNGLTRYEPNASRVSGRLGALYRQELGECYLLGRRYEEARRTFLSVMAWAEAGGVGRSPVLIRTLLSLGICRLEAGDPSGALPDLRAAKRAASDFELDHLDPYIEVRLARAFLELDRIEAARLAVSSARARLGLAGEPWLEVEADLLSARLARVEDDRDALWFHLDRALDLARRSEDLPYVGKVGLDIIALGSPSVSDAEHEPLVEAVGALRSILETVADRSVFDRIDRDRAAEMLSTLDRAGSGPAEERPTIDVADEERADLLERLVIDAEALVAISRS